MTMTDYTAQTISSTGVITATDDDGITHHYHTDAEESRLFLMNMSWLSAGRDELGLLVNTHRSLGWAMRRQADARTDAEIKTAWLSKVTSAGMPKASALEFLEARLSMTD